MQLFMVDNYIRILDLDATDARKVQNPQRIRRHSRCVSRVRIEPPIQAILGAGKSEIWESTDREYELNSGLS